MTLLKACKKLELSFLTSELQGSHVVTTQNSFLCAFFSLPIKKQKQIIKSNNRVTENTVAPLDLVSGLRNQSLKKRMFLLPGAMVMQKGLANHTEGSCGCEVSTKALQRLTLTLFCVPVSLQEKIIVLFPMYNLPNAFFVVFKVSEQDCDL